MIEVRVNGLNIAPILAGPPRISDQLDASCRTLEISVQASDALTAHEGQPIELWYNGKRWYFGFIFRRNVRDSGAITYTAYDPLYYLAKNPDDYYFKNITATQGFEKLADKLGIPVYKLENTRAVFKALYYQGGDPDKIAVDLLARTYNETKKKYWHRFESAADKFGWHLFERTVPTEVWAFQVGVNLVSAEVSESIEEIATIVKLVNRETGKTVVKTDSAGLAKYGPFTHFEEVNKDQLKTMDKKAADLLTKLKKVSTEMRAAGINTDAIMPQFYSGDIIYIEERYTGLVGGYYIKNVDHSFESDGLISLNFDVIAAPELPTLEYEDATKAPDNGKKKDDKGVSSNPVYNEKMKALISKYDIKGGK